MIPSNPVCPRRRRGATAKQHWETARPWLHLEIKLYKLRQQTVEPVFGLINEVMEFRRFRLPDRAKVALEWTLVCVSCKLKRFFALKNAAAAG